MQFSGYLILFVVRQFNQSTLIIDQMLLISGLLFVLGFILTNPKLESNWVPKFSRFHNHPEYSDSIARLSIAGFAALFFLTTSVQAIANVDRSRSMFIFEWIGCAPMSSGMKNIEANITEKFGTESLLAFRQRLDEQKTRGFAQVENSKVWLTKSGLTLFEVLKLINRVYNLTGWSKNLLWRVPGCSL